MSKIAGWFLVCVSLFAIQDVQAQQALQFVTEYLRGFAAMEHVRVAEERELQTPNVDMVATCIRRANQYRDEVALQIARMRSMNAAPEWRDLLGRVVALDERKLGIYSEIVAACRSLSTRSGDNSVGSLEVMAAVSRYNARVDAVDYSLFQTSTDTFMTLLGPRGKSRRLSITEAERQTLLRRIQLDFGAELDEDQQTYLVNAASVIRDALRSHTAADAQ